MTATPSFHHLRIERRDSGVVRATLARPPVNALDRALVEDLTELGRVLAGERKTRVLVLDAEGKAFCAGADLKERRGMSEEQVEQTVLRLRGAMESVAAIPFPTIAAIHGVAAGGGCELALACDLRVIDEKARIGLPECGLAIIPGAGATQRLPRLVGPARTKKWIFTARLFDAAEAFADGVVDRVTPSGGVLAAALELAGQIADCGPVAIRAAKRAIDGASDATSLAEGLAMEWECYRTVIPTEDRREALLAFAEKRKPVYRGR